MNRLLNALACCMLITIVLPIATVTALTRTVGVSVGDVFKYSCSYESIGFTTSPTGSDKNKDLDWIQTTVTSISGTKARFLSIGHYKNGTETTGASITIDVDWQGENIIDNLISANLNANDAIYAIENSYIINETIVKASPLGSRPTNHLILTSNETWTDTNGTIINRVTSSNHYWDKQTGILVEMSISITDQTNTSYSRESLSNTLIEAGVSPSIPTLPPSPSLSATPTPTPSIPEFPSTLTVLALMAITAFSVFMVKKKLRSD
jgi:hypothetical protein